MPEPGQRGTPAHTMVEQNSPPMGRPPHSGGIRVGGKGGLHLWAHWMPFLHPPQKSSVTLGQDGGVAYPLGTSDPSRKSVSRTPTPRLSEQLHSNMGLSSVQAVRRIAEH